jgi:glycosyltransferase involved in cell wall biosynthesis
VHEWIRQRGIADIALCGDVRGAEKHALLNRADICVLPTRFEGMPLTVLEAMYYGQTIVASRVGGLRDFFETGVMGEALTEVSATSLVTALERVLGDGVRRAAAAAHNHAFAESHFRSSIAGRRLRTFSAWAVADAQLGSPQARDLIWRDWDTELHRQQDHATEGSTDRP